MEDSEYFLFLVIFITDFNYGYNYDVQPSQSFMSHRSWNFRHEIKSLGSLTSFQFYITQKKSRKIPFLANLDSNEFPCY